MIFWNYLTSYYFTSTKLRNTLPWRRKWKPAPVFLPGKFHGQRSLVGYSPRGHKESDTTECMSIHTHTHTRFTIKERIISFPLILALPNDSDSKESACNAGDPSSIPGSGRYPGERNGNPLQYSCLENSMDREVWRAIVHRVTKIQIWLKDWTPPSHAASKGWSWTLTLVFSTIPQYLRNRKSNTVY